MRNRWTSILSLAVLSAAIALPAHAQDIFEEEFRNGTLQTGELQTEALRTRETPLEQETQPDYIPAPAPEPASGPHPNLGIELGGGFQTFTGELGDRTNAGFGVNLRAILGVRSRVGLELGYLGAFNVAERTEDLEKTTATLYSNSAEALARLSFSGHRSAVRPYIAGGVNFTRMDTRLSTPLGSRELDNRNGIGVPLAAGVQIMPDEGFTVSARANYNVLTGILDERLGDQWGVTLAAGALF